MDGSHKRRPLWTGKAGEKFLDPKLLTNTCISKRAVISIIRVSEKDIMPVKQKGRVSFTQRSMGERNSAERERVVPPEWGRLEGSKCITYERDIYSHGQKYWSDNAPVLPEFFCLFWYSHVYSFCLHWKNTKKLRKKSQIWYHSTQNPKNGLDKMIGTLKLIFGSTTEINRFL